MPTFVVTGPDGKQYKVTAPEGATDEEVKAKVQAEVGSQGAPDMASEYQQRLGSGQSGDEIMGWLQSQNASPETIQQAQAQIQYRDANPNVPVEQYPVTAQDRPGIGAATQSAIAGAVQGAGGALYDFPMDVAGGVEKGITYALTEGGGALADAVGAEGVADWWRESGGKRLEQLDNPASLSNQRVTDVVEGISPTPEGMGGSRFAAQFIGGAAIPMGPRGAPARPVGPASREVIGGTTIQPGWQPGPRAPTNPITRTAARKTIEAAAENQIRVMTSDVRPPTTFTGKIARATGERIPYAGTGGPRAAQQQERVEAIKRLAREFGYDETVPYLDDVTDNLVRKRTAQIKRLSKHKDNIIDGVSGTVRAPKAVSEIDRQITKLRGINEALYAPVIAKLENFKGVLSGGKTLREVEENRKLLGDMFADPNLAAIKGTGQKALNKIYAPLREDMGAFIQSRAGGEKFDAWKTANDRLAALAGELGDNVFKNVLNTAETTPENVARLLFSKKPSEVRRLVYNLSPKGVAKAKAGIIHLAVEKAGGLGNISPDKFANAIAQNARAAGVVFSGDDLARLNGLQRVLQATKQASVASAAPPTGVQNAPIIGGFAAGSMMDLGTSLATFGGAGGLARLYESAATRDLLVGLSKTEPGSKAEGAILQRITSALTSQSEIQAGNAARAANENSIVAPLAAQDEPRQAN